MPIGWQITIIITVKLNSTYFDSIRIKSAKQRPAEKRCEWPGCTAVAGHKSPKSQPNNGEYHHYCTVHAREYNKSYNYFSGMNDEENKSFRKGAETGHRPTWRMGQRGASVYRTVQTRFDRKETGDAFGLFGDGNPARPARKVSNAAAKAFDTMGLDPRTEASAIKAKYKSLVKMHHPDANGGTREAEDRLIEIIQAYRYLREAGFC